MKSFIAFVAGAIIGGIAAYIYADKKKTEEFEKELEEYKRYYNKKHNCCDDSESCVIDKKDTEIIPQEVIEKVSEMQEAIKKHKTAYNKIINEKGYDTMNAEVKPYRISPDDYFNLSGNSYPDYDRVELYFNPEDRELFDTDGEFLEDPDEMVGMDNLSDLIERVATEVYICNSEQQVLYDVCIEEN